MRRWVIAAFVLVCSSAAADPATAKKHNNAGMKLYSESDYEGAKALFEKAIAEDPAFVKAHYNRASMAGILGDFAAMKDEFAWLRASKDPEAARVLTKSKSDLDFSGVYLIDAAREVLGLAPVADTPMDQLVLAYGGWWSGVDEGMSEGWVEVRFMPKGKVKGRDHSGDDGKWFPWSGTWKVDGRTIVVTVRKSKTTYEIADCAKEMGIDGARCLSRDGAVSLTPGPDDN